MSQKYLIYFVLMACRLGSSLLYLFQKVRQKAEPRELKKMNDMKAKSNKVMTELHGIIPSSQEGFDAINNALGICYKIENDTPLTKKEIRRFEKLCWLFDIE